MIGGGATAAGMGHVVVMDDSPAQLALTALLAARLWQELVAELPADCEYDPCGTLWVAADEEEMAAAREKEQTLRAHGVAAELLDARQLAEAEPQLAPRAGGRPGRAGRPGRISALCRPLADRSGPRVKGPKFVWAARSSRWAAIMSMLADGTRLTAGDGGQRRGNGRCAALAPGVPIRPRKGHLAITERYPGFLHHQLIELGYIKSARETPTESVAFNVQPRRTGQVLIGSSRQFEQRIGAVSKSPILRRMLCRAIEYLPGLARLTVVRTWTGFRAASRRQAAANRSLAAVWPACIWPPVTKAWESRWHWGPRNC